MPDWQKLFETDHPTALITGAGAPRIGAVIARTLAARGCRIAVHARRALDSANELVEELRAAGGEALVVSGDVGNEQDVRRMVDDTRERFGRLDVLVNSAAIWSPERLEDVTVETLRRNWETNTLGVFLCCQIAGLAMAAQPRGGAIVNIGDWATRRPYLNHAAYFAAKGAINTLTRTFAVELAQRNPRVRVNAVLPGPVMLPPDMSAAEKQAAINATLVRREGSPQNVADAVCALVENDFITGASLPVDGGRSILSAPVSE